MEFKSVFKRAAPRLVIAAAFAVSWYCIQSVMETPYSEGGLSPDIRLSPAPALAFASVIYAAAAWFNYLRLDKVMSFGRKREDDRFKKEMNMKMDAVRTRRLADGAARTRDEGCNEGCNEGGDEPAPMPIGEDEAARMDAKLKIAANLTAAVFLAALTFFFAR
jgi:hypothetical protein